MPELHEVTRGGNPLTQACVTRGGSEAELKTEPGLAWPRDPQASLPHMGVRAWSPSSSPTTGEGKAAPGTAGRALASLLPILSPV